MNDILLDVSRLLWRAWRRQLPTGIDRACLAYVQHYRDEAFAVVQRGGFTYVLGKRASEDLFDLLLRSPPNIRGELLRLIPRLLTERGPARTLLKGALYLNIGHTGLNQPGHGHWVARTGVRAIYYVHDLIPITHPQYAREGEPERHEARMRTVLLRGAGVIGNSEDSLTQLRLFAQDHSLAVPPELCAPLGVEPFIRRVAPTSPIQEPYFVVLGTIEGRKNHALMLEIWRELTRNQAEPIPKLVIIGQRGWSAGPIFDVLDNDKQLSPYVMELGRCSDGALQAWLCNARALLFPSFVEGQGLPLIEALGAGTPVIASNLAVFQETAGLIPDYIDPDDLSGWLAVVQDYAREDSLRRADQMERMKAFAPPSWDEHFIMVRQWLARLSPDG